MGFSIRAVDYFNTSNPGMSFVPDLYSDWSLYGFIAGGRCSKEYGVYLGDLVVIALWSFHLFGSCSYACFANGELTSRSYSCFNHGRTTFHKSILGK